MWGGIRAVTAYPVAAADVNVEICLFFLVWQPREGDVIIMNKKRNAFAEASSHAFGVMSP